MLNKNLIKLTFFSYLLFYLVSINNARSTNIDQVLIITTQTNYDIKLEKLRLAKVKATKGDALSEFLPSITANYTRGRQKYDAANINRGDLDKMTTQDSKELTIIQPIFNGFKGYNRAKEIGHNIKQAEQYYQTKKADILFSAVNAYLDLHKFRTVLTLKQENQQNFTKLVKLVKQRNKSGAITSAEVINYQTKLSDAQIQVIAAKIELSKTKENYQDIIGNIDYDLTLPQIDKILIGNQEQLIKLLLEDNPHLKRYKSIIKASKAVLNQSRAGFLPTVELYGSVKREENVTYLDNDTLSSEGLYLNVSIPLFQSGTEYSAMSQSRRQLAFARQELKVYQRRLTKDLKQTYQRYSLYQDLLDSAAQMINLTKLKIVKINQKLKVKEGDMINLLNSKIELNSFLEKELTNKIDYINSYYRLLILTNQL